MRLLALTGVALLVLAAGGAQAWGSEAPTARQPAPILAYATQVSVRRGATLTVRLHPTDSFVRADVLRAGTASRRDVRPGLPVSLAWGVAAGRSIVRLPTSGLRSGLYFVRLRARGGLGYAPFVVRPPRLGEHRVAVVVPTHTWQAYNYLDESGDGLGDSWYVDPRRLSVHLDRPYLDHGIPPHYAAYDSGFMRWLELWGHAPDVLAQPDVERAGAERLRASYDLIVFPGHHEYVTAAELDAIEGFRRRGGSLAFLSANNLFYRVERQGDVLIRTGRWRDLGRPEAAIIGVQYSDWSRGRWPNRPFTVVGARRVPWVFRDTGFEDGDGLGRFGIEIDSRTAASPRGTIVLAHAPGIFGPGTTAEMTIHRTPAGGRVFAAGAFTIGGQALWPGISQLIDNLWHGLARRTGHTPPR